MVKEYGGIKSMNFTDEELYTLSDGILALIRDAGDVKKLVHREQTQLAIDEEVNRLTALNSKICGMIKE